MKAVNLYQFIDTWKNVDNSIFAKYQTYTGIGNAQNGIRESELNDLTKLTECLHNNGVIINNIDCFYIGYSIPQIGKEFDLLRFGNNYNLNIEIKRSSTVDKIENQLQRNFYYLSFLEKKTFLFTFITESKELYQLVDNNIKKVSFQKLCGSITNQQLSDIPDIDSLFDPTNYLVSPFNSTEKFIKCEYFLTKQQEEIKRKVMDSMKSRNNKFLTITGTAGTGKTLLTYDIAKSAIANGYRVLILHCAQLNQGQILLRDKYGWNIFQAKDGIRKNFNNYNIIIVDEAQRAYPQQYDAITQGVEGSNSLCIFSFDSSQCLSYDELSWDISGKINSLDAYTFKLNKKIRTNKEIATFIKHLLNTRLKPKGVKFPNINVSFCTKQQSPQKILEYLHQKGWKVPKYTPGTYSTFRYEYYGITEEDSVHAVIGQEYDNIVAVIDNNFYYDNDDSLKSLKDKCYSQRQMLFQILTRTRKKLHILVIDNPMVFEKCLEILS